MRVLLADDDDALYRGALQKSLERWGYEVVSASDGKEALDILLSHARAKGKALYLHPGESMREKLR